MVSSESSFLGFGQQNVKGNPATFDSVFQYLLFRRSNFGPQNISIPLGGEVGGGAVERNVVKVGVTAGGAIEFIPRPDTLGHMFYGVTGQYTAPADPPYNLHTFDFATDHFSAPYYTVRYSPGGLWGEQYADCRFNFLSLEWQAANFVTGTVGLQGITPTKVSTSNWGALAKVDSGPQFLAPKGAIELPTGVSAKVLAGSFIATAAIPMDQQFTVGNYYPAGVDITQRAFVLNLTVKITDEDLYEKAQYDPAQSGAWAANIFKEADFLLNFKSDKTFEDDGAVTRNYEFTIAANGSSGSGANVAWTAQPLELIAQRQVVMQLQGTFLADPSGNTPLTITLRTDYPTYATALAGSWSPSASASASVSPTPSASVSPSASESPSESPSGSPSASASPS